MLLEQLGRLKRQPFFQCPDPDNFSLIPVSRCSMWKSYLFIGKYSRIWLSGLTFHLGTAEFSLHSLVSLLRIFCSWIRRLGEAIEVWAASKGNWDSTAKKKKKKMAAFLSRTSRLGLSYFRYFKV